MTNATAARLLPMPPRSGLPAWCDALLDRPDAGDLFATRLWYDTVLAHALPKDAKPVLAACLGGDGQPVAALPLLGARDGRLGSLTTPYSLAWRPLLAPGADAAALRAAGEALGRLLRRRPPVRLEAMEQDSPGLDGLLAGLRRAGMAPGSYRHFGNWHESLPPGTRWDAYLAARPPALRATIRRKLARSEARLRFELLAEPGPALEAGIAAYEDIRARSWKPHEPFPAFDGALMRAAAGIGALRLGVLRDARGGAGRPVAAQYWVLDGGGAREGGSRAAGARRALLLKLAHAEEQRAASPGTVLTALMIQRLLEEDRVQELDFGRGDDPYKRLWAGRRRQRIGLVLADPLHPAGALELLRRAAGRARRALGGLGRPPGAEARPA